MPNLKSRIPSLALAFSVAASSVALGFAANDHFNPPSPAMNTTDVVKAVMPAVVKIDVTVASESPGEKEGHGLGSGFIIDGKNGYIVTNNHVAGKASKIIVRLANDKKYVGTLVGTDELSDISVIQIKPEPGTVLPQQSFADSDKVQLGDSVLAIGSPFGLKDTVSTGVVSALNRNVDNPVQRLIQNDVAVNPGNSGGPLFNKDGKVIGVNNEIYSKTGQSAGISFAIPSNLVKMVAAKLITDKKMHWGYMGIVMEMSKDGPKKDAIEPDAPLNIVVKEVIAGSPAEKSGLKTGDIILGANGQDAKDSADLSHTVIPLQVGAKVDITYIRAGKKAHTIVTLGEQMKSAAAEAPEDGSPQDGPSGPDAPKFHFGTPLP
jgi:serine protease Do